MGQQAVSRSFHVGNGRYLRACCGSGKSYSCEGRYGIYRQYKDGGTLVGTVTREKRGRWIVTGYPDEPKRYLWEAVLLLAENNP